MPYCPADPLSWFSCVSWFPISLQNRRSSRGSIPVPGTPYPSQRLVAGRPGWARHGMRRMRQVSSRAASIAWSVSLFAEYSAV